MEMDSHLLFRCRRNGGHLSWRRASTPTRAGWGSQKHPPGSAGQRRTERGPGGARSCCAQRRAAPRRTGTSSGGKSPSGQKEEKCPCGQTAQETRRRFLTRRSKVFPRFCPSLRFLCVWGFPSLKPRAHRRKMGRPTCVPRAWAAMGRPVQTPNAAAEPEATGNGPARVCASKWASRPLQSAGRPSVSYSDGNRGVTGDPAGQGRGGTRRAPGRVSALPAGGGQATGTAPAPGLRHPPLAAEQGTPRPLSPVFSDPALSCHNGELGTSYPPSPAPSEHPSGVSVRRTTRIPGDLVSSFVKPPFPASWPRCPAPSLGDLSPARCRAPAWPPDVPGLPEPPSLCHTGAHAPRPHAPVTLHLPLEGTRQAFRGPSRRPLCGRGPVSVLRA